MRFPGFLGNDRVKAALAAAFDADRFPHAVLLQGEAGTGKRTLAGLLANALVCRCPDRERRPCGECPSCIRARAGSHPDIRVVEGAGAVRSLTVDMVKAVSADAYRAPEEADRSVYILLMGPRALDAAQNKLLKLIEEPPESAVFLLVAESAEQLLPTIRSRVQSFALKPPSPEEAAAYLMKEKNAAPAEAERLAALCGGNIGRMLEELEGGDAAKAQETAVKLAEGVLSPFGDELMRTAAPLQKDKKLCGEALARLEMIFRDALVLRAGGTERQLSMLSGAGTQADKLAALPLERLAALSQAAGEFRQKLDRNANMGLMVTALCMKLREAAGK